MSVAATLFTSSTKSCSGRVPWPIVWNVAAIRSSPCSNLAAIRRVRRRLRRQASQRAPLVQGYVLRLVALDLVLRFFAARVMDVALVVHVAGVYAHDSAADPPGLGVPAHVIPDF